MLVLKEMGAGGSRRAWSAGRTAGATRFRARNSTPYNSTIAGVGKADGVLLVGCDQRHEALVLNTRIRQRYVAGHSLISVISSPALDLAYPAKWLGDQLMAVGRRQCPVVVAACRELAGGQAHRS